jgi:hypothetical protein
MLTKISERAFVPDHAKRKMIPNQGVIVKSMQSGWYMGADGYHVFIQNRGSYSVFFGCTHPDIPNELGGFLDFSVPEYTPPPCILEELPSSVSICSGEAWCDRCQKKHKVI